jgi:signal transduction histidine kinase
MAFIGHDLRNLTNDLSLALANARAHIGKPEFQRDLLLSMEDSVAGMRRLLDRLRRPQKDPPAATVIDLTRVIGDSMGSRRSGGQGPAFRVLIEPDPLPVVGDPDRVLAVSGHLVRNAVEATGPEGRITVRLRRDGDQSLLEVADDGPGMSREFVRERLLHPFTSTESRGLGLGLYQCRKLAEELGGQLEIESEPGSGTVARLRLPLAEGESPERKAEARRVGG